jgi:CRISPR system Cascade subunit CasD
MATLLLRLQGPLQSWGLDARFGERQTAAEPSKSGVLGLVCAALGRDRSESIDDLCQLRMGVRIDREGGVLRDYHTALDVPTSDVKGSDTVLSNRWYLTDAVFLIGLEGDGRVLGLLAEALRKPVWPMSLGRKACVPSEPVFLPDGLSALSLETALSQYPPLVSPTGDRCRMVIEDPNGSQSRPDQPIAPFSERRFGMRAVRTEYLVCT